MSVSRLRSWLLFFPVFIYASVAIPLSSLPFLRHRRVHINIAAARKFLGLSNISPIRPSSPVPQSFPATSSNQRRGDKITLQGIPSDNNRIKRTPPNSGKTKVLVTTRGSPSKRDVLSGKPGAGARGSAPVSKRGRRGVQGGGREKKRRLHPATEKHLREVCRQAAMAALPLEHRMANMALEEEGILRARGRESEKKVSFNLRSPCSRENSVPSDSLSFIRRKKKSKRDKTPGGLISREDTPKPPPNTPWVPDHSSVESTSDSQEIQMAD